MAKHVLRYSKESRELRPSCRKEIAHQLHRKSKRVELTENSEMKKTTQFKMQERKMQDWKLPDENAGLNSAGMKLWDQSCMNVKCGTDLEFAVMFA